MQAQAELKKAKAQKIKAKVFSRKPRAVSKKTEAISLDKEKLEKEILREARALKIAKEEAGAYAKKVAERTTSWAKKRAKVTKTDINEKIAKEIEKYNKDLAFIYKNRGKII